VNSNKTITIDRAKPTKKMNGKRRRKQKTKKTVKTSQHCQHNLYIEEQDKKNVQKRAKQDKTKQKATKQWKNINKETRTYLHRARARQHNIYK